MRQLRQRISVNRFLSSLDYIETSRYIDHRLKLVGSNFASCFETNCLPLIYRLTDGVPRQINQICDNALLICKTTGLKKVNKKIVKKTYAALRSDLLFTPKSFKEKKGKSFMSWKILKPMALGSVIVLLFIGGLRYADVIKPLVSRISLQPSNQKVTTPNVQKESTQEKKSQAPQPLSATQNPSSPDATSQLGGEMNAANRQITTSQDKPLEAGPQNSADDFLKLNPPLPVSPEAEKVSPEGLPPAPPLIATPPQEANPASVLKNRWNKEAEAKSVSASSGSQPGEKGLKEKEDQP